MSTRLRQDADPTALAGVLAAWMPRQRWFTTKGGSPVEPRPVGRAVLGAGLTVEFVEVRAADGAVTLYQVPLSVRPVEDPALADALVGRLPAGPGGAGGWVYDGLRDPVLLRAWLRLLADGGTATGPDGAAVRGVREPGGPPLAPDARAQVLAGEQSNTSVVVDAGGGAAAAGGVIVKLFRVLAAGDNPDVVVQSALAAGGCERVARRVGRLDGSWPGDAGPVHGHLAVAAEFLAGSEDAWRLACRAVEAGTGFEGPARELGAATAEVHLTLARVRPTRPATPQVLADLADRLRARVDWAADQVPALAPYAAAARAAVDGVREARAGLVLQQVHGDYHLGQVLHSPARGWVLVDFEGEPLRPLAERLAPDLALRDVAGMLRSFDYAARHTTVALPPDDPRVAAATAWAQRCRGAFLDGYGSVAGADPRADAALLRALELDKALYEVVYETRNRPDWVAVPMHAVKWLLPLVIG